MQRLLAALFAVGAAVVAVADTQVVCTITAQAQTACSAITVSEAARLDPCRCNANGGGGGAEPSVYDDAIALWKLDEASGTRADSIGSLDLTDNNTVGSTSKGVGAPANLPGTVASFVAANSESLSSASLDNLYASSYTVSLWIRVRVDGYGAAVTLHDGVGGTVLYGSGDSLAGGATYGLFAGYNPTDAWTSTGGWDASPPTDDFDWHHVAVTWNQSTKTLTIYVDGSVRGTPATTTVEPFSFGGSTDKFQIGMQAALAYTPDVTFNPDISTVAIWNYVKDADAVAALYNSGDGAVLP